MRIFRLVGNWMAGALDVSMGMLIATLVARALGMEIHIFHLALGATLALLPDFDIFVPVFVEKVEGNHRTTLMHKPLLILGVSLLVGGTFGLWSGNWFWALCALPCLLWHYAHDTGGWWLGNGSIAWAWPFNPTLYPRTGLIELRHSEWIEKEWLVPSRLSVKELCLGWILSGLAIGLSFFSTEAGVGFAAFACVSTLCVWISYQAILRTRIQEKRA